ncbi:Uncharacterised protein [Mycobacteroides abscessus subsp. abscessus]|nr:Uncharacterised protein [Mycobacteroides abscessus subsp. abscessus]
MGGMASAIPPIAGGPQHSTRRSRGQSGLSYTTGKIGASDATPQVIGLNSVATRPGLKRWASRQSCVACSNAAAKQWCS